MLAGAVINSLRHEYYDTGRLPYGILSRAQLLARLQEEEEKASYAGMAEPYRSLMLGKPWPKEEASPEEPGDDAETKVIPLRRRNKQ
jgi:hypothetical protein